MTGRDFKVLQFIKINGGEVKGDELSKQQYRQCLRLARERRLKVVFIEDIDAAFGKRKRTPIRLVLEILFGMIAGLFGSLVVLYFSGFILQL